MKTSSKTAKDISAATPRPLFERLLLAALARNGNVLRPYPADAAAEDLAAAIADLRGHGLVHGPRHEPNLTLAGRDAARALDAAASAQAKAAA